MCPQRSFGNTYAYIDHLADARSPEAVRDEVLRYVSRFGATHVFAGVMPAKGMGPRDQRNHVLINAWPAEWIGDYFRLGHLEHDPTIKLVRHRHAPFLWSEIQDASTLDRAARDVMEQASEHGLREGLTLSIPTLDAKIIGFSIAGKRLQISPEDRSNIAFIADMAVARLLQLKRASSASRNKPMTDREILVLQLRSEGVPTDRIADELHITGDGVDFIMRSIRDKLGVTRSEHAIGEGFRLGLLR